MSDFYLAMAETALKLIKEKGRSIPITRRENISVDPVDGTVVATISDGLITAVVLPASKGTVEAFDNRLSDQPLSFDKIRFLLVSAADASFEPRALDELQFDGSTWEVAGCTALSPAGIPLIYKMGAKRR